MILISAVCRHKEGFGAGDKILMRILAVICRRCHHATRANSWLDGAGAPRGNSRRDEIGESGDTPSFGSSVIGLPNDNAQGLCLSAMDVEAMRAFARPGLTLVRANLCFALRAPRFSSTI